jgi:hypothetical protein
MIVSIHQPSYFPWLQLIDKIRQSDRFVLLDTVQLSDSLFQHRNLFLNTNGEQHILTIPIERKGHLNSTIKDIRISQSKWQKKHNRFLFFNYKKHPYFNEIYPTLQPFFERDYRFLIDALDDSMRLSFELLGVETEIVRASSLTLNPELRKEQHVLDILRCVKATKYLSGNGAKAYQTETNFTSQGIDLHYQEFVMPIYEQRNTDAFDGGLSCLDLLFNLGVQTSQQLVAGAIE